MSPAVDRRTWLKAAGGAMVGAGQLEQSDIVHLIMADLFVAGIATIIQAVGFWRFGVRLPLMQGVTFAAVGPMITMFMPVRAANTCPAGPPTPYQTGGMGFCTGRSTMGASV